MKAVNQEAVAFLTKIRERAEEDKIRATKAINILIDSFPEITRPECYNSAQIVGINKLTARNVWDKRHDGSA